MSMVMETYKKYREPILYVIVGGMTTVVNFAVYFLCTRALGIMPLIGNGIGWVCAVSFAYFADKIVVFRSKNFDRMSVLKEAATFVAARLVTGAVDMGLFFVLNTLLHMNDIVVKLITQVIVIVGNYLFSKFVIFKDKGTV